jgi:PIN domain nuclease of toxin-antitoxin system
MDLAMRFLPDPKTWFARVMAGPAIREASLTPEIAIDASFLPGELRGDPGDRLIVTTARRLGVPVVTRDHRIIAYSRDGLVQIIPC